MPNKIDKKVDAPILKRFRLRLAQLERKQKTGENNGDTGEIYGGKMEIACQKYVFRNIPIVLVTVILVFTKVYFYFIVKF
jgi:hypothetical protein